MASVILRALGILFILPSLFFGTVLNWFPGLPEVSNWIFLGIGAVLYIAGAVVSSMERRRDKNSELEEDL